MKSYKCICCGFEIKPVLHQYTDMLKPWQGMWDGGTVELLDMPYGSTLDGDKYVIGLCDTCIEQKVQEGIIEKI